ncbi:MAG TPA: PAS domain S-box protein [Nocardioidaceae bacterium]|nr:PAS domain S-box protein [Nocardioidaceae bacterium]
MTPSGSLAADGTRGPVGVLVVDDDRQVRAMLGAVLGRDPRVEVIGEAHDGLQALRCAQELSPQLMLLDISMPRLDGIAVARRLGAVSPRTCVVMYTSHDDPGLAEQALRVGAHGVVSKAHPVERLVDEMLEILARHSPGGLPGGEVAAELHRSEERFRLLVEAVEDYAIFMLDPAGVIVSWNSGAERIKGYSASEIIGRHFRVFYPEDKQEEAYPEYELVQALADGHFEEEGWRVRKDGSLMWANVLITAVHDNEGHHIGFAKVTRDITERRLQQEERERRSAELAVANDQLAQVARERTDFLAVTAHELRTPVNVISGSATTLSRYWDDLGKDEANTLLATIADSAARLNRLLNDLLTASKIESGGVDLRLAPVPLRTLLEDRVAAARVSHAEAPELVVEDDLVVEADRDRLAQVIDNLVQNAYRHGRPPVRIELCERGDSVEILVADAGDGVPAGSEQRIFDRYVTGGARTTGLGLYIVRELARAHHGDAWWRNDDSGAAGFVIRLPRSQPTSVEAVARAG